VTESIIKVLPYIAPPVLGACIGYLTNYLAIRMLFRPLTKKKFFGIRVPFTPGIIPKQRHELATSIGRMVSTQLLTEEAVTKHVNKDEIQQSIRNSVEELVEGFFSSNVTMEDNQQGTAKKGLIKVLDTLLSSFLETPYFEHLLFKGIRTGLDRIQHITLLDIADSGQIYDFVHKKFIPVLLSEATERYLINQIENWLNHHVENNTTLNQIIPEQAPALLADTLYSIYPSLIEELIRWMNKSERRMDFEARGTELLQSILERLNFFQKLLISAAQYNRVLEEQVPEIVDDFLWHIQDLLRRERTRKQVRDLVEQGFTNYMKRGVQDVLSEFDENAPEKAHIGIKKSIHTIMQQRELRERLEQGILTYIEQYADMEIGNMLNNSFNVSMEDIGVIITKKTMKWIRSIEDKNDSIVLGLINIFTRKQQTGETSVEKLLPVKDKQKEKLTQILHANISTALSHQLPRIVREFNVQQFVENRINGLEIDQVERLLLIVISKHLKWINLFGALLGSLIGGIQILMQLCFY